MQEQKNMDASPADNLIPCLLFHAAAREGSRQVADQDDIVNRADDP